MRRPASKSSTPSANSAEKAWAEWTKGVEIHEVAADSVAFSVDRANLADRRVQRVEVSFRLEPTSLSWAGHELTLGFKFEFGMRYRKQRSEEVAPFLQASMSYRATYVVPEGSTTQPDFADRFHKQIALAHVFPFVRAQLADLFMRAGLPPLYLPLAHIRQGTPRKRQSRRGKGA